MGIFIVFDLGWFQILNAEDIKYVLSKIYSEVCMFSSLLESHFTEEFVLVYSLVSVQTADWP